MAFCGTVRQLASTAIDRVAPDRDRIIAETAGYAATDLVCYRAEEPAELVARQAAHWDPLIDWLRERYDVSLQTASGVMAIPQSDQALAALRRAVYERVAARWSELGLAGTPPALRTFHDEIEQP